MDKYEFNIKVEQIKKLVNKGDFETAMKIADTIDWRRVRSTSLLTMISQIYEKNAEYQDAKDILLLAYERAPLGKGLLYKLTDLHCVKIIFRRQRHITGSSVSCPAMTRASTCFVS